MSGIYFPMLVVKADVATHAGFLYRRQTLDRLVGHKPVFGEFGQKHILRPSLSATVDRVGQIDHEHVSHEASNFRMEGDELWCDIRITTEFTQLVPLLPKLKLALRGFAIHVQEQVGEQKVSVITAYDFVTVDLVDPNIHYVPPLKAIDIPETLAEA